MSMPSPLSVKRRKLNDATSRLSKPFVSPMRTHKLSQTTKTPLKETATQANLLHQPYTPSTLAHTVKPSLPAPNPILKPAISNPASAKGVSTPLRKQPSLTWSTGKKKLDPTQVAAQRVNTSLEVQIRKLQNDLDVFKQAQQIMNSSTDADLETLTDKWRLCSQAVAEELFGTVKERVQRMGGVAAWREMEKCKYERANGMGDFAREEEQVKDDADCEFDSEGEELPEDEQEYRKSMKRKAQQELMDAAEPEDKPDVDDVGRKNKVWQEEGDDDDSFTMDMMLRSLNIDLTVIGYDKQMQRWVV